MPICGAGDGTSCHWGDWAIARMEGRSVVPCWGSNGQFSSSNSHSCRGIPGASCTAPSRSDGTGVPGTGVPRSNVWYASLALATNGSMWKLLADCMVVVDLDCWVVISL